MKKKCLYIMITIIMLIIFISINIPTVLGVGEYEVDISVEPNDVQQKWRQISIYKSDGSLQYPGQWSYQETGDQYDAGGHYIVNAENTDNLTGFYRPDTNFSKMEISMDLGGFNADDDYMGCMIRFSENNQKFTGYVFVMRNTDIWGPAESGLYKLENSNFDGNILKNNLVCKCNTENLYWKRYEYTNVKITAIDNTITVYIDANGDGNQEEVLRYTDTNNPILQGSYGFWSWSQPQARFKNIKGKGILATYRATFDPNGGELADGAIKSKDVISTQVYGTLPKTKPRTGYRAWDGKWYFSKTDNNYITENSLVEISNDTTFFAHWTPIEYTVKYNGNGSTGGATADSAHKYDQDKTLTPNGFVKQYVVTYNHNYANSVNETKVATYTFKNWNINAAGTGKSYNNSQVVNNLTSKDGDTINLYAQWNPGSVSYTPTRTGYTFSGWYTESTCQNKVNDNFVPTQNTTLYAKWTPIGYTVKYNGNGSTGGATADSTHIYDESKALTPNGFERKYTVTYNHNYANSVDEKRVATYTFKNWTRTKEDTGESFTDKQSVKNLSAENSGVVNLYAQWNPGSVSYTPTRTGYIFSGWYTESTCQNKASDNYVPTQNTTLYAKWTPIEYTVKYNGNKATGGATADSKHIYDQEKELTPNGFERKYTVTYNHNYPDSVDEKRIATYTFKSWTRTKEDTGESFTDKQSVKNLSSENSGVVNLYAQWNPGSVSYTPTRTGYIFDGWYTESTCQNKVNDEFVPTQDTTLYAKWTPIKYTVRYNGNKATGGNTAESTHIYDQEKELTPNGFERKYTVTYNHNYANSVDEKRVATYTFRNWNLNAEGTERTFAEKEKVLNLSSEEGGVVDLYAQWNPGSVSYTPTRVGYIFDGWCLDENCENKILEADNTVYIPTQDITLYAKWIPIKYTVKYHGNKATSGDTADSIHTYDEPKALTENGFKREYKVTFNHNYSFGGEEERVAEYTFKNWSINENGSGNTYKNKEKVLNLSSEEGGVVDLYAQWNPGSVSYTPTRTGYTFIGWYLDKECTQKILEPNNTEYIPTKDIELYAGWRINQYQYKIKYYYNGVLYNENTETHLATFMDLITIYPEKPMEGYELRSVDYCPLRITEREDLNVINVYYVKKTAKVIVHYYEEGTVNRLSNDVIIEGKVGDPYTTKPAEDIPKEYELVKMPDNSEGIMQEDIIEVDYNYKLKDGKVIVKYLEKDTLKKVEEDVEIEGKIGSEYNAEEKEIEGYECVGNSGNTTGTIKLEPTEVEYYYAGKTKVIVRHIDVETNDVIIEEEKEGLVGDLYTSRAKDIEHYILERKPQKETVRMTKEPIVLEYYYRKVHPASVIEKHIDIKSEEVLYNQTYKGYEGDPYTTKEKEFEGYDIVMEQYPDNSEGYMIDGVIEVKYYYIRKASVKVEYVDKETGRKLQEKDPETEKEKDSTEYIYGHEGDIYETKEKEFEGYELIEVPDNSKGEMKIEVKENGTVVTETVVTYYYGRKARVIERHIDIKQEEMIDEEIIYESYVGDDYEITEKEIEGYDIVKEKMPKNSKGKMTKEDIIVEYYYIRKASVKVEYVDKETGEILKGKNIETGELEDSTEYMYGHEGDKYETKEKGFEGYEIVEVPENWKGEMKVERKEDGTVETELVVTYYYSIKMQVKVEYVEKETGETLKGKNTETGELEDSTEYIYGHEGDQYETKEKEFEGYKLLEKPENWKGEMKAERKEDGTVETEIVVKYYYEKEEEKTEPVEPNKDNKPENKPEKPSKEPSNVPSQEQVKEEKREEQVIQANTGESTEKTQNNNSDNTKEEEKRTTEKPNIAPYTGDKTPIIAGGTIIVVIISNIIAQFILWLKGKKKIYK